MIFIISLIICIALHELGHLFAAKAVKCEVEVFSIGFGKPIFQKKIGKTVYQIAWIPVGGFCKLQDELVFSKKKHIFPNLPYSQKLLVVLAGCAVNIITGIIAFAIGHFSHIYAFLYFGFFSVLLGLSNLLPIPALDGSYPVLVWLEKPYGKEKGYLLMAKICRVGFIILMILNIISIPLIIQMAMKGML